MAGAIVERRLAADVEGARAELERELRNGALALKGGPGRAEARRRVEAARAAVKEAERRFERVTGRAAPKRS